MVVPVRLPRKGSSLFFVLLFLLFVFKLEEEVVFGQRLRSTSDFAGLYSLRSTLAIRSKDWPRKTDPCTGWTGIGCRSGRVTTLDLSSLRRTRLGKLNPQFSVDGLQNLTSLSVLNSTRFALSGPIPEWFGSRLPASMLVIDLRFSSINGTAPSSLGNLSGLVELSLSGNMLTGGIPMSFGKLRNLTSLDLSNNKLTGSLPSVLGDLSLLQVLDVSGNSLSGPVPGDLKNFKRLRVLDLGKNSLSGSLPEDLFSGFSLLESLNLGENSFSGNLPDSFWVLSQLRFVDLSSNSFTGPLPEIVSQFNTSDAVFKISNNLFHNSLPSWIGHVVRSSGILDISGNYFEGVLPFDGGGIGNVSVEFNCFRSTTNQRSLTDCTSFYAARGLLYEGFNSPTTSTHRRSRKQLIYILVGVFGGFLVVVVVVLLLVICLKKRQAASTRQKEVSPFPVGSGRKSPNSGFSLNLLAMGDSYTYDQLFQVTSSFNDTNLIKHGHSGDLYHGTLPSGACVVVKRIDVRMLPKEPYLVELDFFAKASHTRLVPLLGHCLENDNEKLLVYKFMPNGDLSSTLYRKMGNEEEGLQSLDWITRLKIAIGIAEALCYLHHECTPPLVHRDIQASSILLDDKFEVRLGSCGEACLQEGDGHQNAFTKFLRLSPSSDQGTSGSPSATSAYDVYCMGKVFLELVTGKLGISGSNDASTIDWIDQTLPFISIYEKELLTSILDPSLIVNEDLMDEVWAMAIVAKSCLNPRPFKRPHVKYVLKALENPLKVVREETISNSARLRATSSRGSWNAALFGSWRSSSDIASLSGPTREIDAKFSGNIGFQGGTGEQSFNRRRPLKEIFPEPSSGVRVIED